MTIRELIDKGWGGQTNFANRYRIPLRTVQNWATGKRTPPDYVITLIECIADLENTIEVKDGMYHSMSADEKELEELRRLEIEDTKKILKLTTENERLKWEKEQIEQELQAYKELVLGKNAPNE